MSSMIRKLNRGIAKHNMQDQGLKLFGKYSPVTAKVWDKRKKKFIFRDDVRKSFFARAWKVYCR